MIRDILQSKPEAGTGSLAARLRASSSATVLFGAESQQETRIAAGQLQPPHMVPSSAGLQIAPSLLNGIRIGRTEASSAIPQILETLVSTLLNTKEKSPICVLLPVADGIAQLSAVLASIECQKVDFPDSRERFLSKLIPGTRVRALPEGNVFVVGERCQQRGVDGIFMHFTEKDLFESNGRKLVPLDQLFRFEVTDRKWPISRSTLSLSTAVPSLIDRLTNTRAFGNTTLYRNRIILIGARTAFEAMLSEFALEPADHLRGMTSAASQFAWGALDDKGNPVVLHPSGAGGSPLIAIARDFPEAAAACLASDEQPGSKVVITSRLDLVLKSLDLAGRIAERQRMVVVADTRRRGDLEPLRRQGWRIWEPNWFDVFSGSVLANQPAPTGLPFLDRSQLSLWSEMGAQVSQRSVPSTSLDEAYRAIVEIGSMLDTEAAQYDDKLQQLKDDVSNAFFQCAGWVFTPGHEAFFAWNSLVAAVLSQAQYVRRYLGDMAASAIKRFCESVKAFAATLEPSSPTPKGEALVQTVFERSVQGISLGIVTGSDRTREEVLRLMSTSDLNVSCASAGAVAHTPRDSTIVMSVVRRDLFGKAFDPWPSREVMLLGYTFEIDIYQQRLARRSRQKAALHLDAQTKRLLTSVDRAEVPAVAASPGVQPDSSVLQGSDAIFDTDSWYWRRKITMPRLAPGEPAQPARVIRFVGRSWMPMSRDHGVVVINIRSSKTSVADVDASELEPGMRILVREGGDRDVIEAVASQLAGVERYKQLRRDASLWREALKAHADDPKYIAQRLKDAGVARHIVTVRMWLGSTSLIGPRSDDDVRAIARAFPLSGKSDEDWKRCSDAIIELRSLHLSAGLRLTDLLATQCGGMLFENAGSELPVDLELGRIWILEVAEIDAELRDCPTPLINKLQWLDARWRDSLLAMRQAGDSAK